MGTGTTKGTKVTFVTEYDRVRRQLKEARDIAIHNAEIARRWRDIAGELAGVLREIEWLEDFRGCACPSCTLTHYQPYQDQIGKHSPDCSLAAALARFDAGMEE